MGMMPVKVVARLDLAVLYGRPSASSPRRATSKEFRTAALPQDFSSAISKTATVRDAHVAIDGVVRQ
jgi:hypothetical protein